MMKRKVDPEPLLDPTDVEMCGANVHYGDMRMRKDGSKARLSDVRLPSEEVEDKSICYSLGLLHPTGRFISLWKALIVVLTMWSAFWVSTEFAFIAVPDLAIVILDSVVDFFFGIDIVLAFFVAVQCPKTLRLITTRKELAKRYLLGPFTSSRSFTLDIFSSIPYSLLFVLFSGYPPGGALGTFLRAVSCLRLYRIPEFYHALTRLERSSSMSYFAIRIVKLSLNIVLAAHFFAVAYFWMTTLEPDPANTWIGQGLGPDWPTQPVFLNYVASIWWSIFVITSIGPAYTAVTTAEQIFGCFYALFGMAALAYTLGTLTMLMVKQSSDTMQYHADLDSLSRYAARTNMPRDMERQLRQQLFMQLQLRKADSTSFLSSLPYHLRMAVARQQYLPILENIPTFAGCSSVFLNQVACELESQVVMRNEVVALEGDVATHLYIVVSGELSREGGPLTAQDGQGLELLQAGSVFGKTAVMYDVPQLFSVRALCPCQLLRLSKPAFAALLRAFPGDAAIIVNHLRKSDDPALSYPWRFRAPLSRVNSSTALSPLPPFTRPLSSAHLHTMQHQQQPQQQHDLGTPTGATTEPPEHLCVSACSAARMGDDITLQSLLSEYPSLATASDYNARTPLHLAASGGHLSCIHLLLQAGAAVNVTDRSGCSPLLEAVKSGHQHAVAALKAAGAALCLSNQGATLCRITATACASVTPTTTPTNASTGPVAATTGASPSPAVPHQPSVFSSLSGSHAGNGSSKSGGEQGRAGDGGSKSSAAAAYLMRLLDAGVDVNAADYSGCTALHVACTKENAGVIQALLEHGADPSLEDEHGTSPLDIVRNLPNNESLSALMVAFTTRAE